MFGLQNRIGKTDFWVEKLELLESFEDCRELKELTVELWEERGGKSVKLYEKEVMFLYEGFEWATVYFEWSKKSIISFANNSLPFRMRWR